MCTTLKLTDTILTALFNVGYIDKTFRSNITDITVSVSSLHNLHGQMILTSANAGYSYCTTDSLLREWVQNDSHIMGLPSGDANSADTGQ